MIEYVLEREGDIAALVAEPIRAVPYLPPTGFWRGYVPPATARHAARVRRDSDRPRQDRRDVRLPARWRHARHSGPWQGARRRHLADRCRAGRPELDVGADWAFGHYTHEKNPVTARAALTTIEIIESEGLVENAARVGALALERLSEWKARNPSVGDVRGVA
jgi:4-aminobutyrate aminotransferase